MIDIVSVNKKLMRHSQQGYFEADWAEILANQTVLAAVRDLNGNPISLPINSKLTLAVVQPFGENTKRACETLQNRSQQMGTVATPKAVLHIGLANVSADEKDDGVTTVVDGVSYNNVRYKTVDRRYPVGSAEPMNNLLEYQHMRPSLTQSRGRNFEDMTAPLWIDTWQIDTIGVVPDPGESPHVPQHLKHKNAYISVLFHNFDRDVALSRVKDFAHFAQFFIGKCKFSITYEYVVCPNSGSVVSEWGRTANIYN